MKERHLRHRAQRGALFGTLLSCAAMFPTIRPRRLRRSPAIRRLVREAHVEPSDFILPLFFSDVLDEPRPVGTMPGLQKVVQAAGRVIRSPEDEGVLVLMDDRYGRAQVQDLLPGWWRTG